MVTVYFTRHAAGASRAASGGGNVGKKKTPNNVWRRLEAGGVRPHQQPRISKLALLDRFISVNSLLNLVSRGVLSPLDKGVKDQIHEGYHALDAMGIRAQAPVHNDRGCPSRGARLRTLSLMFVLELRLRYTSTYYAHASSREHEYTMFSIASEVARREASAATAASASTDSAEWVLCEHSRAFMQTLRDEGLEGKFVSFGGRCACRISAIPVQLLHLLPISRSVPAS